MAARPRRRLIWASLAALAVFGTVLAGSVLYATSLPAEYTGLGVLQFSPRPVRNGPVVGNETVAAAASGSVAYMGAPSTLQSVASTAGLVTSELRSGLKITLIPATTTVTVEYTDTDARKAAAVTNAVMTSAVNRARTDPLVVANTLAKAPVPQNPSGPARLVIAAAGGLLALILAAVTLALLVVPSRRWSLVQLLAGSAEPEAADDAPAPRPQPPGPVGPLSAETPSRSPGRVVTVEPVVRNRRDG